MKSTHSKYGDVVIKFNSQSERILAPEVDGKPMQYLPCDGMCGQLLVTPLNAVSVICINCAKA